VDRLDEWVRNWSDPPAEYRGAPFWSWNAELDPERLARAIESMHAAGMGGFFMHSRYGLKTPYLSDEWFRCVSACLAKARQLGMKAYLYDEDRWPSGPAGGLVTRDHADYRMHYLQARPAGRPAREGGETLATFAIRRDRDGRVAEYRMLPEGQAGDGQAVCFDVHRLPATGWHNDGAYLDTMNPDATDEFLHVTHQAYADRFREDFGGLVPAIFTDEPNYMHTFGVRLEDAEDMPAAPWTPLLPREFIARRGYDLREKLPELFWPLASGDFSKVRLDYHRTITELFVENFTARIGAWCGRYGIALTGHMLSEQLLEGQVSSIGAAMPHYAHMQWPGIDVLCDQADELSTAKQCSSVADQFGKQRVLSELYGCTGWDWPLSGHKFVGDWQLACGVNLRCPHLTHYSLAGGGKRDYPASIFSHSPWWKYYGAVEDYFGRLCYMLARGRAVRDVLVIHPIESAWGLYRRGAKVQDEPMKQLDGAFKRLIHALSAAHYDWDFGDESLLAEHGKAAGRTLKVGQMAYKLVLVPPCLTLRGTTVALLERFCAGGGKVLLAGGPATMIDGQPDSGIQKLTTKAATCSREGPDLISALERMLPRRVSITADGEEAGFVWYMLRAVPGGQVLFAQSHDRRLARRVQFSVAGSGPVLLWDAASGRRTRLPAETGAGRIRFQLALAPAGSVLLSLGLPGEGVEAAPPAATVVEARSIDGPYDIELTEPNTMPLDYCRFAMGRDDLSQPVPTLTADRLIRKRFGLGDRIGRQHQPWYLYATGKVDLRPRGTCRMLRTFHVSSKPRRCALAIERPEDFRISVNGRAVRKVSGWWVDRDIKTIDISRHLRKGDNEILLTFDYRPDMELEDLYLVGDFGVARLGDGPAEPGNFTLTARPEQLRLGSWVGQGLDFYTAAVMYRMTVERPPSRRVRIRLPDVACTAAAIHAGGKTFALPWPPFEAEITDALQPGQNEVNVEVIGGRKNIFGPLHTPWQRWTGPGQFDPRNEQWTREYLLTDHGLMQPPLIEILA